ncbi:response regulator [Pedococcus sp. KACC 23699]|uniref:Transcriptional regulatory protein n=1 Tax=Pedococcus sp. KACC 23699 TaxID=3149228 RepID=A0AAU7JRT6_9MICO
MPEVRVLGVLVVEDEPVALEAHAAYVGRVEGFEVVATAGTAKAALQALQTVRVDIVLLDMNLPDGHGLDIIRAMRAAGHRADVIAVTSARDLAIVRGAVSLGVVQYLLKPFVFATLRDRLEAYAAYRRQLPSSEQVDSQAQVDDVLAGVRPSTRTSLPKGMSEDLLSRVTRMLQDTAATTGMSASELGERVGVSRVTARRYAEFLCETRVVVRRSRYAGQGRPEVEYRWVG